MHGVTITVEKDQEDLTLYQITDLFRILALAHEYDSESVNEYFPHNEEQLSLKD